MNPVITARNKSMVRITENIFFSLNLLFKKRTIGDPIMAKTNEKARYTKIELICITKATAPAIKQRISTALIIPFEISLAFCIDIFISNVSNN